MRDILQKMWLMLLKTVMVNGNKEEVRHSPGQRRLRTSQLLCPRQNPRTEKGLERKKLVKSRGAGGRGGEGKGRKYTSVGFLVVTNIIKYCKWDICITFATFLVP